MGEAYKLLEAPKPEIEGPEGQKLREYDKSLQLCRVELEALKILEQKIDGMIDDNNKIKALNHLSHKGLILQNNVTEIKIRCEREAGRLLVELERSFPSGDWIQFMQNDRYCYQVQEMFTQRIQELEPRGIQ